jgi:hypothetical protein
MLNRKASTDVAAIWTILVPVFAWLVSVVAPEKAGIVGAMVYLFAQHELGNLKDRLVYSVPLLVFFGYLGSWVVTHVISVDLYSSASPGMIQFMSAIFGFLSYDTIMLFTGNTTSVIQTLSSFVWGITKKKVN